MREPATLLDDDVMTRTHLSYSAALDERADAERRLGEARRAKVVTAYISLGALLRPMSWRGVLAGFVGTTLPCFAAVSVLSLGPAAVVPQWLLLAVGAAWYGVWYACLIVARRKRAASGVAR